MQMAPAARSPVCVVPDPIRGGDNVLVMCQVLSPDGTPHPTNTRAPLQALLTPEVVKAAPMYGFEQVMGNLELGRRLMYCAGRLERRRLRCPKHMAPCLDGPVSEHMQAQLAFALQPDLPAPRGLIRLDFLL